MRNISLICCTFAECEYETHETAILAMARKGKPFIKWVGGKGQLLEQIQSLLPDNFSEWNDVTYIEPFVGGGAMLFYMLQTYPNIKRSVINDINPELAQCYTTVRNKPKELVASLRKIQKQYYALKNEEDKREFFMTQRDRYNSKELSDIENSTIFIFLNRTCFNGLYRVNKAGLFNVPFGRYDSPTICDEGTIMADSEILQKVEILNKDFEETIKEADTTTLFYFDPPYRPLSNTSSFNSYAKEAFNDDAQIRLKRFCDRVNEGGYYFMLSNSDGYAKDCNDTFFDDLYCNYNIKRVWASRSVNADATKRGKLTEILVRNYN